MYMKWKFLVVSCDADSCGILLRQNPWEDTWCLERVCIGLNGHWRGACIASCATRYWSPIFTDLASLKEAWQWTGNPASSGCSHWLAQFGRGWLLFAGSCHHCWFMFDILTLLNWTAGILTNGGWNRPPKLLLHRPTSLCPIYHLYLPLDGGLGVGGSKCLRTPVRSRFKKI